MWQIKSNGGAIPAEIAAAIDKHNIPYTCESGVCEITEDAYYELYNNKKDISAVLDDLITEGCITMTFCESPGSKAVTSLEELVEYLVSNESKRIGDEYGAELVLIARRNGWEFADHYIRIDGVRYRAFFTDGRKVLAYIQEGDDIASAVVAEWTVSYDKQDDGNVTVTSYWRQCTEVKKSPNQNEDSGANHPYGS